MTPYEVNTVNTDWKKWSERRGGLGRDDVVECLRNLSIAYRDIPEDVRIPLMTRMRPLPDIIRMMRTAEFSNDPVTAAYLCVQINNAPTDLRQAIMQLRAILLPEDITPHMSLWRNSQMAQIGNLPAPYPPMIRFVEAYSLAEGHEGDGFPHHHWENAAIAAHELLGQRNEGWTAPCDHWFETCFDDLDVAAFQKMRVAAHHGSMIGVDRRDVLASLSSLQAEFAVYHLTSSASEDTMQVPSVVDSEASQVTAPHEGVFGYYVNLDERGEFYADVRNANEETIFEIHSGDDGIDLITDGFMSHCEDIQGLETYLKDLGIIDNDAELLTSDAFEDRTSTPSLEM